MKSMRSSYPLVLFESVNRGSRQERCWLHLLLCCAHCRWCCSHCRCRCRCCCGTGWRWLRDWIGCGCGWCCHCFLCKSRFWFKKKYWWGGEKSEVSILFSFCNCVILANICSVELFSCAEWVSCGIVCLWFVCCTMSVGSILITLPHLSQASGWLCMWIMFWIWFLNFQMDLIILSDIHTNEQALRAVIEQYESMLLWYHVVVLQCSLNGVQRASCAPLLWWWWWWWWWCWACAVLLCCAGRPRSVRRWGRRTARDRHRSTHPQRSGRGLSLLVSRLYSGKCLDASLNCLFHWNYITPQSQL